MNHNLVNELQTMEKCGSLQNGLWDISDLSVYLKVKIKTIYSMVPDIPHYRIGKLIRFKKEEIDSWLECKRNNDHGEIRKPRIIKNEYDNIDVLIRKTIDQVKQEDYNPDHGKSDRIKAHGKES